MGVERGAKKIFAVKNKPVTKDHKGSRTWTDSVDKRPKLRKMDKRFGMSFKTGGKTSRPS
jgi:hypothetical protein